MSYSITPGYSTQSWSTGPLTLASTGHNIQPAVELDDSGNALVTYYAFPASSSSYTHVARYIAYGSTTPETAVTFSSITSNVANYGRANSKSYIGDYHDVSFSNGTFKVVGIAIDSNDVGNPRAYTLQHQ